MNAAPGQSLRILYHHRIAAADGMLVHVEEVVEALRQAGHVVKMVGPPAGDGAKAGGASRLERLADRLRRWLPPAGFELLELAYNLPAYLRLSAAVRAFRPDVIYERYNLFLLAGLALKRQKRIPLLLEVNSPLAEERAAFGDLQLKSVARACESAQWNGADAVLTVTEVLAGKIRQVRRTPGGVQVVPNGAHLDTAIAPRHTAELRHALGLPDDALVLGFVGFVRAWHGVGWALDAMAELPPETHLVIVGDGPALPQLAARARDLGLAGRVHLLGRVEHAEVAGYMALFDVALQTAAVAYASPLKLFEYMALGRAIVAPDQPNIREILRDGENAQLFAPDSEAAFRLALSRLCADPALRARLGANAARAVRETPYTWAHNAVRIEGVARALLRPRGDAAPAYAASPA